MVIYAAAENIDERVFVGEVQSHSRIWLRPGCENCGVAPTLALICTQMILRMGI